MNILEKDFIMLKLYYIYILTNDRKTVLYVGVTNDINRRTFEHRELKNNSFCQKYNLTNLIYFEETTDVKAAIAREKQIKKWRREKKIALINSMNPEWRDLL